MLRSNSITRLTVFTLVLISVRCNPNIAIIGGGIGGTSCAYYLNQLFQRNVSLTLFERDTIGGRLATVNIDENDYESGGSIIHSRNQYMKYFTRILGLAERPEPEASSLWGIYNGKEFVFEDSRWNLLNLVRFLWRYGYDFFRMSSLINSLLYDFDHIYDAQDKKLAFKTVQGLLNQMSSTFSGMTQRTLMSMMKEKGFSDRFISEFAEAIMLVNYGQTTSLNSFAGFVSLAATQSGLWSIKGGNKLVPDGLFTRSKANLITADVKNVALTEAGDFALRYHEKSTNTSIIAKYDAVVLAAPLMAGMPNIEFENFHQDFHKFEGKYHQTVATFVQGTLKMSAFNINRVLDAVLTNNNSFIFNSLGKLLPVSGIEPLDKKSVYKLFSKVPMTEEQLNSIFYNIQNVKMRKWLAYPHYSPPEKLPPFELYPKLYYTNAVEWADSAMEMSVVAGRNVALLIYNTLNGHFDSIDTKSKAEKDEL